MSHNEEKNLQQKESSHRLVKILRKALPWLGVLIALGLAGSHLGTLIFGEDFLGGILIKPEQKVSETMTPIQTGFSSLIETIRNELYKLKLRSRIEEEYTALRAENEQLIYDNMLVQELQQKLSIYENLYDEITANESMNPLTATVIGTENSNYFSVFTINKGTRDGVRDYMAVTSGGALIGYTYNCTEYKSTVRSIIDSEASIAALISSTRDQGTVRGTLGVDGKAMCRMYYLPENAMPRPGDLVVTSGVSMSFPKGIPIGHVRESTRGMESNKQYIVVEPMADFQHVEYVIVLRYQPQAVAVEERASSNDMLAFSTLAPVQPVPTVQIGSEFFQLAPTPEPKETPAPTVTIGADGFEIVLTPEPTTTVDSYEYQIPVGGTQTENSFGFTLAPTATPTPTPPPLDLSVEED